MANDYKFEAWVAEDPSAADGNMIWKEYTPKTWEERDMDIKITHSAICATDLHVMKSDWGRAPYPLVTGHEVVGEIVRVGSEVKGDFKVGDIVGFGSAIDSCDSCGACRSGREHCCPKSIHTYGGVHKNGDPTRGGHGLYARVPAQRVFKIPENLAPEHAAPLLCAGITVFRPLKEAGVGPGSKVGIVGLGGLGHIGVMFAKAMGASEVVVISRKADKKNDAVELGATDFISTDDDVDWEVKNAGRFDVIVNTAASSKMPMDGYVKILRIDGTLCQLGAPDSPVSIDLYPFVMGQKRIVGSLIGSPQETREMLKLAADKEIKPWVEQRPMKEANQAMIDFAANKARYRYVLKN